MDNKDIDSEIIENLLYIKTITNYKVEYCKQISSYFLIWGLIWIIDYLIIILFTDAYVIGFLVCILGVIGWIISLIMYSKQKKMLLLPLFLRIQLRYAWLGIFTIFGIMVFFTILSFTLNHLFFYTVIWVSIMYIILGIVLAKEIFFMGIWLAFFGVATFSIFPSLMNIVLTFIGGGSLLLMGFILRRKG